MKILFFSEAVSLAHVGRPLNLAKWAQDNGVDSHFACSHAILKNNTISTFGLPYHPLYTIDGNLFYNRVNQGNFFYKVEELKKYVAEELALIKEINPDLIVSDFRLTTSISSHLTNKPLLNLSNSYWSPSYTCPFPAPEAGIFNLLPHRTTEFIFNLIRPFAFKFFGKELNQTRKFYGLKLKHDFREHYTDGNFTAYMDLPHFVSIKNLPKNHFYLGPVIWSPKMEGKKLKLKDDNNIYISMGSSGNKSVLPIVIHSALKNKFNLVLSGVTSSEKSELLNQIPELTGRSIIEPLLNAEEILPYCKLTICHGGSSTVYQSVENGVPVLCLPKNPDQGLVSLAVSQKNIGRTISHKNINFLTLDAMIKECTLNDVIHQSTKKMQSEIRQWDTKLHWMQFLNKFKTIRKTNKIFA